MKHFFIIGGSSLQRDFLHCVKRAGFISHVFDYDKNCVCKGEADFFHLISVDEKEQILALALKYQIAGIGTSASELGNITACYVGEKLNLGTNSYQTALNTTDKSKMKEIFKRFNIPCASYLVVQDIKELEKLDLKFPLVIKPSDRSAGRGVMLVRDKSELLEHFGYCQSLAYNKKVLLEELLYGKQFSVETISSHSKHRIIAITEEYFNDSNDFCETNNLIPARISDDEKTLIHKECLRVLEAFDIKFGAAHIELKLNKNKINFIEIASRTGGFRDELIHNAFGVDYNELLLQSILKENLPDFSLKARQFCLVKMILLENILSFIRQ
ncbi:ATP-grasp domain-containing protein [Candidatus Campylobacter infans]|uniref:ATP-grasp domain-containing protein n=1 Tax=Candidatus Campylobacter infans TaxID=2561898 RepID=UPI0015D3A665|nr:ATP-grasp domain-containing protein [Candidatus Campylobacter infans]